MPLFFAVVADKWCGTRATLPVQVHGSTLSSIHNAGGITALGDWGGGTQRGRGGSGRGGGGTCLSRAWSRGSIWVTSLGWAALPAYKVVEPARVTFKDLPFFQQFGHPGLVIPTGEHTALLFDRINDALADVVMQEVDKVIGGVGIGLNCNTLGLHQQLTPASEIFFDRHLALSESGHLCLSLLHLIERGERLEERLFEGVPLIVLVGQEGPHFVEIGRRPLPGIALLHVGEDQLNLPAVSELLAGRLEVKLDLVPPRVELGLVPIKDRGFAGFSVVVIIEVIHCQ